MHKLRKVLEQIHKELEAAEDYIECALISDDDRKDVYKSLSRDELSHAEKLMNMCEKHVEEDKKLIWEFEKDMLKHKHLTLKTKFSHVE